MVGKMAYQRAAALTLAVLLVLLSLCGCSASESVQGTDQKIYFLNADRSLLSSQAYEPLDGRRAEDMDVQELISDVLVQLGTAPDDRSCSQPIQDFTVVGTILTGNALTINLSAEYYNLDSTLEVLTRAAIVNSLCGIDGVDSVSFLCDGEELRETDGDIVGAMTSDQFILSAGNEIDSYEKVRLHLYFANESGDQLVDTYRTVVYNANISMERLVVEQVLKGPNSDVVHPTLNSATQILSVTTRDYVCYVNLDQNFLEEPNNVTSQVAIYSLVNSLTELTSVREVQILIDGDSSRNFMDTSLSSSFKRNLSIVKGSSDAGSDSE